MVYSKALEKSIYETGIEVFLLYSLQFINSVSGLGLELGGSDVAIPHHYSKTRVSEIKFFACFFDLLVFFYLSLHFF